jgi:hypothetical protein
MGSIFGGSKEPESDISQSGDNASAVGKTVGGEEESK